MTSLFSKAFPLMRVETGLCGALGSIVDPQTKERLPVVRFSTPGHFGLQVGDQVFDFNRIIAELPSLVEAQLVVSNGQAPETGSVEVEFRVVALSGGNQDLLLLSEHVYREIHSGTSNFVQVTINSVASSDLVRDDEFKVIPVVDHRTKV